MRAIYSQEYPPIFMYWGGEPMTAKDIIKKLWQLSGG
jgi:hypothetical protein